MTLFSTFIYVSNKLFFQIGYQLDTSPLSLRQCLKIYMQLSLAQSISPYLWQARADELQYGHLSPVGPQPQLACASVCPCWWGHPDER